MYNWKTLISFFCFLMIGLTYSSAQDLKLPQKSPKAVTSFSVGLTEITIRYSSPAVRGREVWGKLEPYDKIWRAGANEATTMTFSTDIIIEGQKLPKGRYSFFIIPKEKGDWIVIFNKVADQWGAYNYEEEKDALRLEVPVKFSKVKEERLTYQIIDQGIDKGYIRLGWEGLRLYLRFQVEVMEEALANIKTALAAAPQDKKWLILAQSADFLLFAEREFGTALDYASQSVALYEHSWNYWILAQAQAANEDFKAAIISAAKSKAIGMASDQDNFYADAAPIIEKAVVEWKKKG